MRKLDVRFIEEDWQVSMRRLLGPPTENDHE